MLLKHGRNVLVAREPLWPVPHLPDHKFTESRQLHLRIKKRVAEDDAIFWASLRWVDALTEYQLSVRDSLATISFPGQRQQEFPSVGCLLGWF